MIVVSCPERAEQAMRAGTMGCPRCPGRLRPHGHGRTRTVRGLGEATLRVRPRRVRCADCGSTQILLPTVVSVRHADATEVIGTALAAKVNGAGYRTIAARLGRPVSTVRRWLRRAGPAHAEWLYQRGVEHAARINRELLAPYSAPYPTTVLATALNLLAGVALTYRERFGQTASPWALIGLMAHGRLLAPPRII